MKALYCNDWPHIDNIGGATMNTLENAVFLHDGHAVTTSLKVAEIFGKSHKNVVRDIRKILEFLEVGLPKIGETSVGDRLNFEPISEFNRRNFPPISYLDPRNREQQMYEITRDGFAFLVMGFTGAEAMKFKIAYIDRFNEMEAVLKEGFHKSMNQVERYWFERRPLWPQIRTLVLKSMPYRAIAAKLQISRDRVARAVKSMIRVGILDPVKVVLNQAGPASRAALRHCLSWGQPSLPLIYG
jgi:Rha family phage regulatory protein